MGVYLQDVLVADGHEVYVTTRSVRPDAEGVHYLVGNAKEDAFLRSILNQVSPDAVVDFMVYDTEAFRGRVNTLLNPAWHYVFLSSYRVFNEAVPLTEASPRLLDSIADEDYLKTDEYGLTKARQENILQESRSLGRWTVVRPGITFSKARFQFGCLEANTVCWRPAHGVPLVMPEAMLDKRTTLTWGGDVAWMIARLILNPTAYHEVFVAATSENHTWREVFEVYREVLGARLVTCTLDEYITVAGRYQVLYDRMFDRVIDNHKVLEATGIAQQEIHDSLAALRDELQAFAAHGLGNLRGNPIMNAKMDLICGGRPYHTGWSWREWGQYWTTRLPWLPWVIGYAELRALKSRLRWP